jgi:hypothetical protein
MAFLVTQIGFNIRLFIVFLLLSVLFVGLTLFTGRRSAETLYFELSQAHKAINESDPADLGEGDKQPSKQQRQVRAR